MVNIKFLELPVLGATQCQKGWGEVGIGSLWFMHLRSKSDATHHGIASEDREWRE